MTERIELLKQVKELQEEVNLLKGRMHHLELTKKDKECYPKYMSPSCPQRKYETTGDPLPPRPYYLVKYDNNTWD